MANCRRNVLLAGFSVVRLFLGKLQGDLKDAQAEGNRSRTTAYSHHRIGLVRVLVL